MKINEKTLVNFLLDYLVIHVMPINNVLQFTYLKYNHRSFILEGNNLRLESFFEFILILMNIPVLISSLNNSKYMLKMN